MKVVYDSDFIIKLKKINVRIRKSLQVRIEIFSKDPFDSLLNNHSLRDKYEGFRSIDITSDWRAIYKELIIGEDTTAYFIAIGTHRDLYGK